MFIASCLVCPSFSLLLLKSIIILQYFREHIEGANKNTNFNVKKNYYLTYIITDLKMSLIR